MIKLKYIAILGVAGTLVGLAGIAPVILQEQSTANAVAHTTNATPVIATPAGPQVTSGHPVRIIIPALTINLAVTDGAYNKNNGSWTLSDHDAMFATITPEPNDTAGNTFIYGHATNQVFGRLPHIKPGDEVAVHTTNGHRFVYRFRESIIVPPTNTSVIANTQQPTLTLQTCSGLWSENRHIFYFDFVRVEQL